MGESLSLTLLHIQCYYVRNPLPPARASKEKAWQIAQARLVPAAMDKATKHQEKRPGKALKLNCLLWLSNYTMAKLKNKLRLLLLLLLLLLLPGTTTTTTMYYYYYYYYRLLLLLLRLLLLLLLLLLQQQQQQRQQQLLLLLDIRDYQS